MFFLMVTVIITSRKDVSFLSFSSLTHSCHVFTKIETKLTDPPQSWTWHYFYRSEEEILHFIPLESILKKKRKKKRKKGKKKHFSDGDNVCERGRQLVWWKTLMCRYIYVLYTPYHTYIYVQTMAYVSHTAKIYIHTIIPLHTYICIYICIYI